MATTLPYIAIAGPTASGKTAAGLALAQHAQTHWNLPCEIISVDSALVYRGMDIGTAKPTPQELQIAPHHLIDIIDPIDSYSAAQFVLDATALITQIRARGHLPLLVGGTMLYFKALIDGLSDLPQADAHIRERIEAEAAQHGWPHMHQQLLAVDAATAQRLAPNDSQRIGRALEVWHATGKPLSYWHAHSQQALGGCPPLLLISLEPQERSWLHQRIAQRFDAMLEQGFVDEVKQLQQHPDLHLGLPSMRCVGYRQVWEGLEQHTPPSDWREKGIIATRQLAKRQLTWLRSMQRHSIAADAPDASEQVIAAAHAALTASCLLTP